MNVEFLFRQEFLNIQIDTPAPFTTPRPILNVVLLSCESLQSWVTSGTLTILSIIKTASSFLRIEFSQLCLGSGE
jgi:hypothetical protein